MIALAFLGALVFLLAAAFLQSVSLYYLWGWFVVPLGVAAIGKAQAYGLMLIVMIALSEKANIPFDERRPAVAMGRALLGPLATLAIGYLVHRLGAL